MPCSCSQRQAPQQFRWTPPEGSPLSEMVYDSEVQAKAKVLRKGGSYEPVARAT